MLVSPVSEIPRDYAKALDGAKLLEDLRSTIALYGEVAADALAIAEAMDDEAFLTFRSALRQERRGKFCGDYLKLTEKQLSDILVIIAPSVMVKVGMVAGQFAVPWGRAYHHLKDAGRLKIKNGIAEVDF